MRIPQPKLAWLLSFLTGLFWASILIGFFRGLIGNWHLGAIYAIASGFFWMIPGVLGVVFIEFIFNSFEQTNLLREQNRLLRELTQEKSKDNS